MRIVDKPTPPKSVARKASEVNRLYEDKAKALLRDALKQCGVTIPELTERLAAIGIVMSSGGVANKISRGGFSCGFFMQCMDALDGYLVFEKK